MVCFQKLLFVIPFSCVLGKNDKSFVLYKTTVFHSMGLFYILCEVRITISILLDDDFGFENRNCWLGVSVWGWGTPITCDSRLMSIYMHEKMLIHGKYSRIGNILLSNNPIWSWETLNLLKIFQFFIKKIIWPLLCCQVEISKLLNKIYTWLRFTIFPRVELSTCFIILNLVKDFCVMSLSMYKVPLMLLILMITSKLY